MQGEIVFSVHSVWKVKENNIPGKAGLESQGLSGKKVFLLFLVMESQRNFFIIV